MQALPGSLGCSIGALPAAAFKGLRSLSAAVLVNAPTLGILLKHYASSSSSSSRSSSVTLPGGAATDSSQSKARWQQETQAAEEAFHDPTAPKSAAESYAAVQQEHVNKLQGMGLNMLAAEAVHKAWVDGSLRAFSATSPLHMQHGVSAQQPLSPGKPLVHLRQLLQEHSKAVAAAAAAGKSADATGGLSWADVDIQTLVALDPRLLMVPSGDIACRLDILLNGVARLLGRDPALRYIHKATRLRLMLAEPEASVQLLQDRYDAYVEVVGVPPRPELLAASESSHTRGPVQTFRKKLEHFVQQWGAESAHAMLSDQPHLLSSNSVSLDKHSKGLQKLLGYTEEQLARFVRKAPRVLSTDDVLLSSNLVELTRLLQPLGFTADDVRQMLSKQPPFLVANPVTVAQKLEALGELLGTSDTGLRYAVRHNPSILAFSTQTLASRFKGLQQLLECDAAAASKLVRKAPTVASLDLNTIANKLEELTSVFSLPLRQVKAMCCNYPFMLVTRPAHIASKFDLWAGMLQVDRSDVVSVVVTYPRIILYDAQVVAAHMELLMALVSRSKKWNMYDVHAAGSSSADSVTAEGLYPLTIAGFQAFRREVHQTLELELPELFGRHARQDSRQLVMHEISQVVSMLWKQYRQQQGPQRQQYQGNRAWPLSYSDNCSGRFVLRLEYLLATGRQEQVSLATAYRSSEAKWMELFPDFQGWVQLRVQHLQQDSSGWPPLLVQRAVKWCAANAQPAKPAGTASAGKAASVQPGGSRNAAATGSNASSAPNRRQHRRGRGRNAPQA